MNYDALISAFIAAYTANFVSHQLGLEKFTVLLTSTVHIDGITIIKLILCGIMFGLVGRGFTFL